MIRKDIKKGNLEFELDNMEMDLQEQYRIFPVTKIHLAMNL